jgi:hypothetical protein
MCWRREDLKPSPAIWGRCCCHQNMTKQSFCNIFTYWPQSLVSDLLQLDQGDFQACLSRQDSYVSLANGRHVFTVTVNMSSGASAVSQFNWTVGETFTKTFVWLFVKQVSWFSWIASWSPGWRLDSFHVPHMRGLSIWKSVFVFKLDFVEAEGKLLYALSLWNAWRNFLTIQHSQ